MILLISRRPAKVFKDAMQSVLNGIIDHRSPDRFWC